MAIEHESLGLGLFFFHPEIEMCDDLDGYHLMLYHKNLVSKRDSAVCLLLFFLKSIITSFTVLTLSIFCAPLCKIAHFLLV